MFGKVEASYLKNLEELLQLRINAFVQFIVWYQISTDLRLLFYGVLQLGVERNSIATIKKQLQLRSSCSCYKKIAFLNGKEDELDNSVLNDAVYIDDRTRLVEEICSLHGLDPLKAIVKVRIDVGQGSLKVK